MKECPKCKSSKFKKNGFACEKQRYKCNNCNHQFTRPTKRGKPEHIKRLAIKLYLEGLGIRSIGRLLHVSSVTVLRWIRKAAEALPAPDQPSQAIVINIDEMWTFVQSKKDPSGSVIRLIQPLDKFCQEWLVVVGSPT